MSSYLIITNYLRHRCDFSCLYSWGNSLRGLRRLAPRTHAGRWWGWDSNSSPYSSRACVFHHDTELPKQGGQAKLRPHSPVLTGDDPGKAPRKEVIKATRWSSKSDGIPGTLASLFSMLRTYLILLIQSTHFLRSAHNPTVQFHTSSHPLPPAQCYSP